MLLTPAYSLGFCTAFFLAIQLLTGFLLSTSYSCSCLSAFPIIHDVIMRDLDSGWVLRFLHSSSCAFFFLCAYSHLIRCCFHDSWCKSIVWSVGVIMYILLCAASFTGYSLVYGQMSLWAIVVICSLVTSIPYIGNDLLTFIFGGAVIHDGTLVRIYSIHFLVPNIILVFLIIHIYHLHLNNSTGHKYRFISGRHDRLNFYPILIARDIFLASLLFIIFAVSLFFFSEFFGHPVNYIPANPLVTPSSIVPEFYLLPFYAIIRAIPHKILGIICMLLFIISLTSISTTSITRYFYSSVWSRSNICLLVFDIFMASNICVRVNHLESLYFILILCIFIILAYVMSHSGSSHAFYLIPLSLVDIFSAFGLTFLLSIYAVYLLVSFYVYSSSSRDSYSYLWSKLTQSSSCASSYASSYSYSTYSIPYLLLLSSRLPFCSDWSSL